MHVLLARSSKNIEFTNLSWVWTSKNGGNSRFWMGPRLDSSELSAPGSHSHKLTRSQSLGFLPNRTLQAISATRTEFAPLQPQVRSQRSNVQCLDRKVFLKILGFGLTKSLPTFVTHSLRRTSQLRSQAVAATGVRSGSDWFV